MNFEDQSFRNLVHFYRRELGLIRDGGNASKIFTARLRSTMLRKGVLKPDGRKIRSGMGRRSVLTDKAVKILEAE